MTLSPERRTALDAALTADPDWQALLRHFDLSEGFAFLVLLVDSRENAELCREYLNIHLLDLNSRDVFPIHFTAPAAFLQLPEILRHPALEDRRPGAMWIEAVVPEADTAFEEWRNAWRTCFAHLNPLRNILQRTIQYPLIFVGAPWVQAVIRESAPDLWSIRTTVTRVSPRGLEIARSSSSEEIAQRWRAPSEEAPDPEFALQQAEALRGKPGNRATLIRLLHRAGEGFVAQHKPEMAVTALQEAYSLQPPTFPYSERSRTLTLLGRAYRMLADWERAESCFTRALELDRAANQEEAVAFDLCDLGSLMWDTNRLSEAERYFRGSIEILEKLGGVDHPTMAKALNNLALVLRDTGRVAEAETLIRRALAIAEKLLGPESPEVTGSLVNLALVLEDQNRFTEAEPLLRRALEIDERMRGPEDPRLAVGCFNLGRLLLQTNRLKEAEPLFRRALGIDERRFAPDHPEIAADLANLGLLLSQIDQSSEAEQVYRRALAIYEKNLGLWDPKLAILLDNLAFLLHRTNRSLEAEALSWRGLQIWKRFERKTGYKHRNFETAVAIYRTIAGELGWPEDQIAERLRQLDTPSDASFLPGSSAHS